MAMYSVDICLSGGSKSLHEAALEFLAKVKTQFPRNFRDAKVLELGSLNINGSPRPFFEDCCYVGVDWREGPDVDLVAFASDLKYPDEMFDTVVSTEMFEHDCFAKVSFVNALRMLKKGGLFVFTCANGKRKPHEIRAGFGGYYKGVTKFQVIEWLLNYGQFSKFCLEEEGEDLRGWVVK